MALRLISEDETRPVEVGGTTFQVRVRPGRWWSDLRADHFEEGEFQSQAFQDAVWSGTLVGWDSLENADGTPIPYSEEAAKKVGRWLPDHVESKIMAVAQGRMRAHEDAVGN